MNILKTAGKFLDQPFLVTKFKRSVPYLLSGAGAAYGIKQIYDTPKDNRKETTYRLVPTLGLTIASAIAAPKICNKIFKNNPLKLNQTEIIDTYLANNAVEENTKNILEKAKSKVLNPKDINKLHKNTSKEFINTLIPEPENITSKEIFSEIGRLSLFGLIPVLGGITGGITGDMLSTSEWKEKIPDKIKEGLYQYLANIFLCNIGAGAALGTLEKMKIKSKTPRALGMIGGIVSTGVIGGSAIANFIGKKIINPMFKSQTPYEPRHPEALDISLHTDDIATVAVMSGLKWIEPALPIMYSISGYRAGIGYRNHSNKAS